MLAGDRAEAAEFGGVINHPEDMALEDHDEGLHDDNPRPDDCPACREDA